MKLRDARKGKGLTQEALADLVGTDQATISDLETGKIGRPSWPLVARISEELDVDPYELFPGEERVS